MADFYNKFTADYLTFQDFVPRPAEAENWYDWNIEHWGTKWDIDGDATYDKSECCFTADFDTAWTPPLKFLETIAVKNPELTFTISFSEPGMQYLGYQKWSNGKAATVIEHSYQSNEELRDLHSSHTEDERAAWWYPDSDCECED